MSVTNSGLMDLAAYTLTLTYAVALGGLALLALARRLSAQPALAPALAPRKA